jgi:predicted amidohydrolase YtcJ
MLLRSVRIGEDVVDVRVNADRIVAIGAGMSPQRDEEVLDGHGGAVIPGLHDHHLHLLAMAAARTSVQVGPPAVTDLAGLAAALSNVDRDRPAGAWLRGVGYHESVAGPLDRRMLDCLVPDRPLRIQHRSGAEWSLNSAGLRQLDLVAAPAGVERDATGEPTGRLRRLDDWLRDQLPPEQPDLAPVGAQLARYGITGVTDATPFADRAGLDRIALAVHSGEISQRVTVTGGVVLAGTPAPAGLSLGPVKVVLADPDLPGLDEVAGWFDTAHTAGRAVAVHCVTRAALVLALTAWETVGARPGDRIEHAAIVPPELATMVRRHGLTVVTQPGFVADRGDRYRSDVDEYDRPYLYPCASLLAQGIPVGGSTDAPFGPADPWVAIRAAIDRGTPDGEPLNPDERLPPRSALALFLGSAEHPGGPHRTVALGQPADLVLLDAPLDQVLADPHAGHVAATIRGGQLVHVAL